MRNEVSTTSEDPNESPNTMANTSNPIHGLTISKKAKNANCSYSYHSTRTYRKVSFLRVIYHFLLVVVVALSHTANPHHIKGKLDEVKNTYVYVRVQGPEMLSQRSGKREQQCGNATEKDLSLGLWRRQPTCVRTIAYFHLFDYLGDTRISNNRHCSNSQYNAHYAMKWINHHWSNLVASVGLKAHGGYS